MISPERPFCIGLSGYATKRQRRRRSVRLLPRCPICRNLFDGPVLDGGTDSKKCQAAHRMRLSRPGRRFHGAP